MSQANDSSLSNEDSQLIGKYHLGQPLDVYRPSARVIRSAYVFALLGAMVCILSSILFVIVLIVYFPIWSRPFSVCLAFLLFVTGAILFVTRHNGEEERIIVCEAGLLRVTKWYWWDYTQVIYWKNIQMRRSYFVRDECRIYYPGGNSLGFVISASQYQNRYELIAFIKEQATKIEG